MENRKVLTSALLTAVVLTTAVCFLIWYKLNIRNEEQEPIVNANSNIQPKNYIQLLFVGDLMFDRGIRYYAEKNKGNEFIFKEIAPLLLSNDLVIANLEGPITNNKSVSSGTVPGSTDNYFFTFDPSVSKSLFKENIRLVNLGNNHILNFGQAGLESTKEYLNDAEVDYFGAPKGERSIIKNINGVRVAFVSYNEFFGNNVDDEQFSTINKIKNEKPKVDIVIVFCHWGVEYSLAPTDAIKSLAHQFVDSGADLIIGSHSHVIGPMEEYNGLPAQAGKRIYYSLGNFVFDQYFNEDVRNGLGVTVKIDKSTKELKFDEIKFYLQKNGQTVLRE